ncbi:GntR family transcriptional regulator [Paenibacillus nasutitermitis]|uniref:LacI family transcriptional regulator n=1 Tax=Paenibacillus nasutitermitis TaxID=1652958 RepID=A0A917DME6_9BACL|nr:GntR family transcriptional regulator [Paenibacillus nasutitermitis]GGD52475.1 LacI family transcriptional regulator [Paenibacillus nasutitermitis]
MGKTVSNVSLYEQIKQYLLTEINQGHWNSHDKLPSENELTEQFSVSRITVKKAMSDLVDQGVIYRVQGKGTFVSSPGAEPSTEEMPVGQPGKQTIALLLPFINNQHNALLLNGVENILSQAGYSLLFCNTENSIEKEERVIREMIGQQVAGMIVYPVDGESYNREILQLTLDSFPLVVMDRYLRGIDTNCVCPDNFQGARDGVNYLISLGHRNIGFLSTAIAGTSSVEDRLAGYERALADNHIPIDHRYRCVDIDLGEPIPIKDKIRVFLDQNPEMTAIFAINPGVGLQVIKLASEIGIRIPLDLSLIFFDDFELSEFHSIRPTFISQEENLLGMEAARLLISLMENPEQNNQKLFFPPKLVIRDSTAKPGHRLISSND